MVPYDRFTVVLDACTLFPMLARDVLLTLAAHEFFSPKWSARIRDEWTRNLRAQMQQRSVDGDAQKRVDRIVVAMTAAFPDADVDVELVELPVLAPVDAKDRHVVATAIAAHADAIVTFNVKDFAAEHLKEQLQIEVIYPDGLMVDLNRGARQYLRLISRQPCAILVSGRELTIRSPGENLYYKH